MSRYRHPLGVTQGRIQHRPFLTTREGGRVVVDNHMLSLWENAHGCQLEEILAWARERGLNPLEIKNALACLYMSGLLTLDEESKVERIALQDQGELVSVIVVSFNSREWLGTCLSSVASQSYQPHEVILVDNASTDDSPGWVEVNHPEVELVSLSYPHSLASAFNIGVEKASGDHYLLLNPDVKLEVDAISHLVASARRNPDCAAVATKLKFLWAPSFLNGLGNYVGAFSWGTDVALGHLDLGQFDRCKEVPSACFAAALIPARAWKTVGPLDEQLPLYYEDSEWCYRARLFGYKVAAAPAAVVYHAFSGRIPTGAEPRLSPQKLHQVSYGRLRFVFKLIGFPYLLRFFGSYFIEDSLYIIVSLLRGRLVEIGSKLGAWRDFLQNIPEILQTRKEIQTKRVRSAQEVFHLQRCLPIPLIWQGLPLLTTDIVRNHYQAWLDRGEAIAEDGFCNEKVLSFSHSSLSLRRFFEIWKLEGMAGALHRLWKYAQWVLMRL